MVALIGFADRALVTEAVPGARRPAWNCPLDLADLVAVLDRLTVPRAEPAHALPPAPAARRVGRRPVADAGRDA